MANAKPLTAPQAKLLARLPQYFQLATDYNQSNCPPTQILGEAGETLHDHFGKGEQRAFEGLCSKGAIVYLGKIESGVKNLYISAYGKA